MLKNRSSLSYTRGTFSNFINNHYNITRKSSLICKYILLLISCVIFFITFDKLLYKLPNIYFCISRQRFNGGKRSRAGAIWRFPSTSIWRATIRTNTQGRQKPSPECWSFVWRWGFQSRRSWCYPAGAFIAIGYPASR